MTMCNHDGLRQDLAQAIGAVFTKHGGAHILGPWVVVAATSDPNDGRAMWAMSGVGELDEAKPWETLGLTGYVEQLEQARTNREYPE